MLPRGGDSIERAHALENLSASLLEREPEHQRLGRYVLLEREGSGGMGVVFSAYDPQLDRKIALKLLRRVRSEPSDDHGRAEVLREARAMARLNHPHVVTVHEVGEEGDRIFLAMEYLAGGTLRSWMQARKRPWADLVRVFVKAGRGLASAHAAGLIHRDFKPENVLMTVSGDPRVADFGLARSGDVESGALETTANTDPLLTSAGGGPVGTPVYMAPEVFAGGTADALSDQFSFCVSLFEALFDRRPFAGDALDTLRENVRSGRIEDPGASGGVPSALRRVVTRGLAVDPAKRFESMDALLEALERFVEPARRGGWWAAGGLAVALGGMALWTVTRPPGAEVGPAPAPCRGSDAAAAQVWTEATGEALARSLSANPRQTRTLVERGNAFASTWSDAHAEACLDTAVRKVQTEARMEARMLCLDGHLRAFSGALRAIGSQGEDGLETALEIFEELPDVDDCADPRRVALETSGEDREAVLAIEEELGRARTLEKFRRPEDAIEIVGVALARARALGEDRLLARALLHLAMMEVRSGEPGRARPHVDEARLVAERSGLDRLVVEALILSSVDAQMSRDVAFALRELDLAQAVLQRYGGDARFEASIEARMGTLAYARGDLETAVSHYRRNLAALAVLGEDDSDAGVSALVNMGLALRDQGKTDESLESLEEARRRCSAAFGPDSPGLATIDLHIAMVLDEEQRFEDALLVLRRGLELSKKARGPVSEEAVQLHAGFGLVHDRLRQHQESLEHSLEGVRILEVLEQTQTPDMAMCLGYAATALVGLGRAQESLELHRRALDVNERALGEAHPEVANSLMQMASAQRALGDRDGARRSYERALGIRIDAQMPRHAIGDARRVLAEFLREHDPTRSREYAVLALADFEASPLNRPDAEAELRALAGE